MKIPKESIVRLAAAKFAARDYQSALELFKSAASKLGEENFRANIIICQKRIDPGICNNKSTKGSENETNKKSIELSNSVNWESFDTKPGEIILAQGIVKVGHGGEKSSIALIKFLDQKGNGIDPKNIPLPRLDVFGENFVYLKDSAGKPHEVFRVKVPKGAVKIEVGFRLFTDDKKTSVVVSGFEIGKTAEKTASSNIFGETTKSPNEFKVALIADEFTYNSFKDEFDAIPVGPETWRDLFQKNKPDIFFCESAWSGPDSVRRPWKGKVYASKNFSWENRKELLEIIAHCRKEGIPSIFWNKEDPSHYEDRVNDFVKTATEFDYVFTCAEECIDRYKKDYGLKNVYALPFATNPRLFNPIVETDRSNKLVFAGSWYATHPDRCTAMESILDHMIAQGIEIEICDRYYGSDDPNRAWPERFKALLKPNAPHEKMAEVYKSSYLGLNFNTVTDSSTMFARRVFELMSCNTLVVSNYSVGVDKMFGQLVVFADKEPSRLKNLTKNEIDQLRETALNLVLKEHTYKRRWEQILDHVGIKYQKRTDSVTIICPIQTSKDA
jgi:spore maturation protein CgeB